MQRLAWAALAVAVLLAAPAAYAQTPGASNAGPAVTVILHHPFLDAADPLGVPFADTGHDAFRLRFAGLAPTVADGEAVFDFPTMVADGKIIVSGIPDGAQPFQSTVTAYQNAFAQRLQSPAPVALTVTSSLDSDRVHARADVQPLPALQAGAPGHLRNASFTVWGALEEDHVQYAPPAALSNGVTDHRFTLRSIQRLATVGDVSVPASVNATFAAAGMDPAQLYVSFWVQRDGVPSASDAATSSGATNGTYAPGEVVQATTHRVLDPVPTVQTSKGVLVEVLSAVWCKPCLYGDLAAERLVQQHGLAAQKGIIVTGTRYYQAPSSWLMPVAAAAVAVAAAVLVARRTA